jgi:NAD(P)-dependent dehydrogenase (short-subunit alcohol dehydrogenase family)
MAESLIRYLAVDLAPKGIRINAIAPAIVETDSVRALFGAKSTDLVRGAAGHNPTGRGVTDADYSRASCSASILRDAELRFHPAEEMRVCALLGPEQPVAARTFHRRREGRHQHALRDELREKIG